MSEKEASSLAKEVWKRKLQQQLFFFFSLSYLTTEHLGKFIYQELKVSLLLVRLLKLPFWNKTDDLTTKVKEPFYGFGQFEIHGAWRVEKSHPILRIWTSSKKSFNFQCRRESVSRIQQGLLKDCYFESFGKIQNQRRKKHLSIKLDHGKGSADHHCLQVVTKCLLRRKYYYYCST